MDLAYDSTNKHRSLPIVCTVDQFVSRANREQRAGERVSNPTSMDLSFLMYIHIHTYIHTYIHCYWLLSLSLSLSMRLSSLTSHISHLSHLSLSLSLCVCACVGARNTSRFLLWPLRSLLASSHHASTFPSRVLFLLPPGISPPLLTAAFPDPHFRILVPFPRFANLICRFIHDFAAPLLFLHWFITFA